VVLGGLSAKAACWISPKWLPLYWKTWWVST